MALPLTTKPEMGKVGVGKGGQGGLSRREGWLELRWTEDSRRDLRQSVLDFLRKKSEIGCSDVKGDHYHA